VADTWGQSIVVHRTPTNPYDSDVSTAATVNILCRLARQYAFDPWVAAGNQQALFALGAGARDRDTASAIFHWIRGTVRFVEDERLLYEELGVEPEHLDKELLLVPPLLLGMPVPMGDCDDFSLLTASMLLAAGLQPFYVTVAADATDARKFSHIYVCAYLEDEDEYMSLDAGNRYTGIPPGWESDKVTRKAIWRI
jgi:transglutaminase-like putative cysteine protease